MLVYALACALVGAQRASCPPPTLPSCEYCSTGRRSVTAVVALAAKLMSTLHYRSYKPQVKHSSHWIPWVVSLITRDGRIYAPELLLQTGALC